MGRPKADPVAIRCTKCKKIKTQKDFYHRPDRTRGHRQPCRACWGPAYASARPKRYGLTVEQYKRLFNLQNGVCAICRKENTAKRALGVDHDHTCCPGDSSCGKCVRGLLCSPCNSGLGLFKDDPYAVGRASVYLDGGAALTDLAPRVRRRQIKEAKQRNRKAFADSIALSLWKTSSNSNENFACPKT